MKYKYIEVTDEFTRLHISGNGSYYRRDWWHDIYQPQRALEMALEIRDNMVNGMLGYAAVRDMKWEEEVGI